MNRQIFYGKKGTIKETNFTFDGSPAKAIYRWEEDKNEWILDTIITRNLDGIGIEEIE